ncbi:cell division protein SepF [Listeria ivanovii]|uniref:cell division protein SepF n=1 Tax=Listeria ivanovii TaxID=1638 RepID=UPI00065DC65A|nr:cell division protein SepF [Listeria ivanovii]MBK3914023.1 cell division protein SepF [Listeria ivanovii subsp. ivanovii]MBK3921139.1 cell division protein SepF [Listeria ivanovii subsp. ivanovii]MBK3926303.1 cell division protein SepF [Listeria ivanovii subsp. ivanovii]PZG39335.1 cell division protein SepF [Listeria ivanovii]
MGLSNKFKSFFFLDEEEEYYEEEVAREPEPMQKKTKKEKPNKNRFYAVEEDDAKVVSMQGAQYSSHMVLAEPRVYAEAQELADYLKEYKTVVVNLQRISHDQATRIVDFLSGTVYALGGDIQRVGNNIFLCTPDNVEVDGSISEMLDEQNFM